MIIYFSATGNNKYIAEKIAENFGDSAISILENEKIELSHNEKLCFVFPTYFWRLPSIVDEYMQKLSITSKDKEPYICFIATYGTTCGGTGRYMKRYLKKIGFTLSASYSIKTVDNWTIGFDLSDQGKIEAALKAEAVQINNIITQIKSETRGNQMKNTLPMIAVMGSNFFYKKSRRTKHFHAENSCISCGLCEKICPTNAIEIQDGKPVWIENQCTLCLGCLHNCPKFAIQYDNKTQNHGQYKHPI